MDHFDPVASLIINDPLLIQEVLKTNARSYQKSNFMRLILKTLLTYHTLLMTEDNINSQHRILSNAKNQGIDLTVNIHNEMARLTLDFVIGCVFESGLIKNEYFQEVIYRNVITT
ncbi:unnamed protein product [Rotaria sp. Silwood2]|nr:unnamed protein product [Rotaria sp. Silwood2]CAF2727736.1 unnamed protein product [Rotaria sp. Silwood2]CAF3537011.1 unnamed protein product [Rotaria sp. Silwood2]CAF4179513.1 unnamed protein product [Rotaria sp. Silwood2]CAF4192802.1 unnamed protein product [Rotaria sp. Silwood2]